MQPTITPNKASRRRAQNASAQRAYRAKQKQKMQRLEALTIAALTSSGPLTEGYIDTSRAQEQGGSGPLQPLITDPTAAQTGALTSATDLNPSSSWYAPTVEAKVSFSRVHALLDACTPRERKTFHVIVMRERFGLRDMIKYGLIQLGYALDPRLFDRARHASSRAWLAEVLAVVGPDVDILAVLGAGIKLLASLSLPETNGEEDVVEEEVLRRVVFARQPDILSNQITITTVALSSAFFANAFLLGIPLSAMVEDEDREMSAQALACTKPDLQPTPAQLAVPHHPSFDVIPWPKFRANICRALAHNPPLIDDGELCLDFMNDGVRCWGSNAGDSLAGRGQGAPWDSRSWEAAPWFLEKWEFLTDGRDGQMWRNSEWWRAMRG
ncbi:hypothetical protein FHL15_006831 [Xylaria flabelliformis]|uniref:BZIP domain-containing protein n=1 Tax=Xylaria flabelliformis TaxID=2512241 RepID=A0A553HW86_9PEZI|nr:hypothetical protein FHL15_006831 [Xylaria flabelliformis]